MMKKILFASTLAATAVIATPASHAGETKTAWKQVGVFSTSTIIGAVAGGPVGMMLGAVGGAYLGEQVKKADESEQTELALAEQALLVAELKTQLSTSTATVDELNQTALDKLALQVLFHTGADQLTERGKNRVISLAEFLNKHPNLSVQLIGHSDPRGTDEYNNVLAEHRAIAVQDALETAGIESYRIQRRAFGSLQSTAPKGDYEAYAMERRVDIEIFTPAMNDKIVQAH